MARILEIVVCMTLLLTLFGLFLPRTYEAEKSMVISTSVQEVFEEVNNLKNWEQWSPWMQIDPDIKINYEGPTVVGIGARVVWTSEHKQVGNGYQEITHVEPHKQIVLTWDVEGNYEPTTTTWTFEEQEDGKVKVTWANTGRTGFNIIKKYQHLSNAPRLEKLFGVGLRRLRRHMEYYTRQPQSGGQHDAKAQQHGEAADDKTIIQ
ncbi:MAG: SRPBCC family protein [Bacteroidota bacterium]